jgi:predicted transcriptional regulator of viral defense system
MPARLFTKLWQELEEDEQPTITRGEVMARTGSSSSSTGVALHRAMQAGRLFSPARGFYVVVPAPRRHDGRVPPDWWLPDLMSHLGRHWYVGLLTAAARHGAHHQAPQHFQVVVDRRIQSSKLGTFDIDSFIDARAADSPTVEQLGAFGAVPVATAETTAFDLVAHMDRVGGPSHVATVLAELGLDPEALASQAQRRPVAVVRRLGHILGTAQPKLDVGGMEPRAQSNNDTTLLVPAGPDRGPIHKRWRLRSNASVEVDDL